MLLPLENLFSSLISTGCFADRELPLALLLLHHTPLDCTIALLASSLQACIVLLS